MRRSPRPRQRFWRLRSSRSPGRRDRDRGFAITPMLALSRLHSTSAPLVFAGIEQAPAHSLALNGRDAEPGGRLRVSDSSSADVCAHARQRRCFPPGPSNPVARVSLFVAGECEAPPRLLDRRSEQARSHLAYKRAVSRVAATSVTGLSLWPGEAVISSLKANALLQIVPSSSDVGVGAGGCSANASDSAGAHASPADRDGSKHTSAIPATRGIAGLGGVAAAIV